MFVKIIGFIVKILIWTWFFISFTSIAMLIIGLAYYFILNPSGIEPISVFISSTFGIFATERIRKKYGLVQFIGRLTSHKEIDGSHMKYKE